MNTRKLITFILIIVFSKFGFAENIDRQPNSFGRGVLLFSAPPSKILDRGEIISPELIEAYGAYKQEHKPVSSSVYVPSNISQNDTAESAARKIADKSVKYYIDQTQIKNFKLVRNVQNFEKIKAEINFGSERDAAQTRTQHKIDFSVKAFETKAQMDYSGLLNASVYYQMYNSTNGVQVKENIGSNKDLIFAQEVSPIERKSEVKFNWNY